MSSRQKTIVIDIDPKGNCSIDAQNFIGTDCEKYIKEIEQTLGTRTSSKQKPEYQRRTTSGCDRNLERGR